MSNKVIEFGIKVNVDGQPASRNIQEIGTAAVITAGQVAQAGNAMAAAFDAGTEAVSKTSQALNAQSETEAQATERIRAMVAASLQQVSASADVAAMIDQASASTRRAADENLNYTRTIAAANAQMTHTPQAAAPTASSEESLKYLATLQRQHDQLGLNAAEQAKFEVAHLGGNKALQEQAYALVSQTDALREQIAAEARSGQTADAFIAKLKEQTATLGMNRTQLLEYKAAQLGVSEAAAPMIAKLAEAGAGANGASGHMDKLNFSTVGARRELLVLAHELSQGNFQKFGGSMLVLGEQTGAAGLLFSSTGLAALGFGAAIISVAGAAIKGSNEQKAMNDALIMTGNYAGLTSDSLNGMAHAAVAAGGSLSEAKKVATELAGSGKFTGDQIGVITEATVAWEHATGQSVKSIIQEFETLAVQTSGSNTRATEAVSRAALKLDDTYHFLTEAVYEQIRALEKEGDAKGASKLATDEFAKATHERAEEVLANLGSIARGWNGIKEAIGQVIDAMGDLGKKQTPAMDVAKYKAQLTRFDEQLAFSNERLGRPADAMGTGLAAARLKIVMDLTHAVERLNEEDAKANAKAEERRTQSEGEHAASRVLADKARLEKKGMSELKIALDEYYSDIEKIKKANPDSVLVTPEAISQHVAAITKAHTERLSTKGQDDRAKVLQDNLLVEQTALEREKNVYEQRNQMLNTYHTKFGLSDTQFYAGREAARAEYIAAEAISFAKESALLQGFQATAKTPQELAENKRRYDALLKQHLDFTDKMRAQVGDDALNGLAGEQKVLNDSDDVVNKYLTSLEQEVQKAEEANAMREQSRGAIERETAARLDLAIAYQQQFMASQAASGATQEEMDQAAKVLKFLQDQRVLRGRLADALDQRDADKSMKKAAEQAIQDWKYVGASIADSLSAGFGVAGKSAGAMFKAYADGAARQLQITKDLKEGTKGMAVGDPERVQAVDRAQRESAAAQLKSYADMAGAARGFFNEGSRGYAAMEAASKTMHAAEVALSLVKGVNAVLTQGEGDPYTAFARMAAMAAIVTGLGVALGGGVSGGQVSAKERQQQAGTGSVFGAEGTRDAAGKVVLVGEKSDSIAKSLSQVSENSKIELEHTAGMLQSLRNIESSISGLGNLIIRTSSLDTQFSNIQTGTKVSGGSAATLAAGLAGGAGGAMAGAYLGIGFAGQGAAIGALAGPAGVIAGAVIGTVAGAIASKLTNVKTSITDQGISIRQQSLGDTVANGVQGNTYADVNVKKSFLGIRYSNKTTEVTGELSAEIEQQFTSVISSLRTGIINAVDVVGAGGDQFIKGLDAISVSIPNLSLKGLSGEEVQKTLEATFSNLGDNLAKQALPGLENFQRVGEGYFQTLTRLASDYANLDSVLQSVGKEFGAVGVSSFAAREHLIDFAGGIDNLAQKVSSFGEDFLSADERNAPIKAYVDQQLAALGYASVTSREQFKDIALSLDLTTAKGAETFATMMNLEAAFAKTHPATAKQSDLLEVQAQICEVLNDKVGAAVVVEKQHALALKDMSEEMAKVSQELWAAQAAEKARKDALDEAAAILAQQAQMYEANGDKAGQAAVLEKQHAAALVDLTPAVRAATEATWAAQAAEKTRKDALDEAAAILAQQAQMYEANGDKAGQAAVLEKQHAAALVDLTPAVRAATEATWAAQAAEKTRKDALNEAATILGLQAQMYEANGDKAGQAAVLEKQHAAALVDLTPAVRAATQATWAAQAAEKARTDAQNEASGILSAQAQMYDILKDKAGAAAVLEKQHVAALAGMSPALAAANLKLWATQSVSKEIEKAQQSLEKAYQAQSETIKDTIKNLNSAIASWKKFKDSVLLGDLSPLTPAQKYAEAQRQFEKTLALAKSGDTAARENLQSVEEAFLQASKTANASDARYQADFAKVQQATDEAINWAQKQVDVDQASLEALNVQVSALIDINDSVKTVADAIHDLQDVMTAAKASSVNTSDDVVDLLYQALLGRKAEQAGLDYWHNAMANGATVSQVADSITKSNEYAALHANPTKLPTFNAPSNYNTTGTQNTTPLVEQVKALRASNEAMTKELQQLRAEQKQQTGDLISASVDASLKGAKAVGDRIDSAAAKQAYIERTKAKLV